MTERSSDAPQMRQIIQDAKDKILRYSEMANDLGLDVEPWANRYSDYRMAKAIIALSAPSETAPTRNEVLEGVLRDLSLATNRYSNTVEDYYLHGLWKARDIVLALKERAAPQATSNRGSEQSQAEAGHQTGTGAGPAAAAPEATTTNRANT